MIGSNETMMTPCSKRRTQGNEIYISRYVRRTRAKEQLIADPVAVLPDIFAKRAGDLPCPDLDNDGQAELQCGSAVSRRTHRR